MDFAQVGYTFHGWMVLCMLVETELSSFDVGTGGKSKYSAKWRWHMATIENLASLSQGREWGYCICALPV
jgi:hypothetical protein